MDLEGQSWIWEALQEVAGSHDEVRARRAEAAERRRLGRYGEAERAMHAAVAQWEERMKGLRAA